MVTVEIRGPGGTINYPVDVIVKALEEAGLQVEVQNDHPSDNADELMGKTKKAISSGEIKDWKVNVKAKHLFWGG